MNYNGNNYGNSYNQANSSFDFVAFFIIVIVLAVIVAFGMLASREARKQGRSETSWFWLGVFFNINAFIALKVSNAADEEAHDIMLWSVFGIFLGIAAIFAFESGLNAENKGHDFDCWCIVGFVFGLLALFVSCFLKPYERKEVLQEKEGNNSLSVQPKKTEVWTCPKCGLANPGDRLYCINCSTLKNKK